MSEVERLARLLAEEHPVYGHNPNESWQALMPDAERLLRERRALARLREGQDG